MYICMHECPSVDFSIFDLLHHRVSVQFIGANVRVLLHRFQVGLRVGELAATHLALWFPTCRYADRRGESGELSCFQVSSPHLAFSLPTCSDADSGESEELVLKSAETQMCQVADSFLFILNFLLVTFIQLCSELHRALKYTTIYIIYVYIYIYSCIHPSG